MKKESALDNFKMFFEDLKKPSYIKKSNLTAKQISRLSIDKV